MNNKKRISVQKHIIAVHIFIILNMCTISSILSGYAQTGPKMTITSWACYYGDNPKDLKKLEQYDLVIIEPDILHFTPPINTKTRYIGYVSIGEAERFRWYWHLIEGREFILWENEHWKDDFLIDIRSSLWQDLLLEKIIPKIINKGYSGLFFDTIDTPLYLEEIDPEKFKGSAAAVGLLIKRIREKYPQLILVSNNGLRGLKHFGAYIDIFLIEGLHTTYDFVKKNYAIADTSWSRQRTGFLDEHEHLVHGKPILVIDYMLPDQAELRKYSLQRCTQRGFLPYHTTVELNVLFDTPQ